MNGADFPRLLALFFTERLMRQRQASPHTIASYRSTFRLLVRYAQRALNKPPSLMTLDDFDTTLLGDFLNHLETERGNDPRTRNTRLAAIRSFFRFVALHEPRYAALAQRVLAIPDKRYTRRPVAYLNRDEIEALLRAPNPRTRTGRRDRTLLLVAVQTGLRASELIGLRCEDVQLGAVAHVRCHGKGRKERCTPLRKDAAAALRAWLKERHGESTDPVFPNQRGGSLSHDSLGYLLSKHLATARTRCPSLAKKRVSAHSLRHYIDCLTMSGTTGRTPILDRDCRSDGERLDPSTRHSPRGTYRLLRKPSSRSSGWYRPGLPAGGVVLASACSFIASVASR